MSSSSLFIISSLLLVATAAVASAGPTNHAAGWFMGEGTQYTLSAPTNGNCNLMSYPAMARTKYAAINRPQFKRTGNCGRCAQVTCVDATKCQGATQATETVYIVDQCPECVHGDLDLSPEVFRAITGHENDRVAIQWKFVDCPVQGAIQYCLKDGSNGFWTAIQPANFAVGVHSLRVNGQATTMVDSAYYFVNDGRSAVETDLSALAITLTSVTGEVIHETISLVSGGCVDSQHQFSVESGATSAVDFEVDSELESVATTPPPIARDAGQPSSSSSSSGSSYRLRHVDQEESTDGNEQVTNDGDAAVHATSPALTVLMLLAGVCIVVLAVLAVVVKHKRRLQRETMAKHDVDHVFELPKLVVRQKSYKELATPSRQADIVLF